MRELLFVVNAASGSLHGQRLITDLGKLVPPDAICRLPGDDLSTWADRCHQCGGALVACGGDGTATSVLEAAWQAHLRVPERPPSPVGVIPLGTGNDLARTFGWSGMGRQLLPGLLQALGDAPIRALDRWVLSGPAGQLPWYNYWSIGLDARILSRFHRVRSRHPLLLRPPLAGRALYAVLGVGALPVPLSTWIRAPRLLPLPEWTDAMLVTSIPSYAGGVCLSPAIQADDGRVETFALAHGVALGLVIAGARKPRCLGQRASIALQLGRSVTMQLDGEPRHAPAGTYHLRHAGKVAFLGAGV